MVKPSGHLDIINKKGGGSDVTFNGQELFVLEDGLNIVVNSPKITTVTLTFAVEKLTVTDASW